MADPGITGSIMTADVATTGDLQTLETPMTATLEVVLHQHRSPAWPAAGTSTRFIHPQAARQRGPMP
jgi:hypothetical protein